MKIDISLRLAKKKISEGLIFEAKEIYEEILKKFPKNVRAKEGLKSLKFDSNLDLKPKKSMPIDKYKIITDLYEKKEFREAISKATSLIKEYSSSEYIYNIIGACYAAINKHNLALDSYKKALKINPNYPDAINNMGNIYRVLGNSEEAITNYKNAIKIKPSYIEAYNNLGNIFQNQGLYEEASEIYNKAIKIDPNFSDTYNNLGNTLGKLGQNEKAIHAYKKAIQKNSKHFTSLNNLGVILHKLGKIEDSIISFKNAIEIKPDYVEAYNNFGNLLQEINNFDEAINNYKKGLKLDPNHANLYNNLGNVERKVGNYEKAIDHFLKALSLKPNMAEAYNNIGNTYHDMKNFKEATKAYNKAIEINPSLAAAYNNLGNNNRDIGEINTAITNYKKALENQPNYSDAYNNLGLALSEKGEYNEAIKCFKEAIQLNPNYAEAFKNYGKILKDLGNLDEAIKCYRRSIEINPDYDEAKFILASLTGQNPKSPPSKYIENLFDHYSMKFETSLLEKLKYEFPWILAKKFTVDDKKNKISSILDLGCGTGLIGEAFKSLCQRIDGVDLSKDMLAIAKNKKIYNNLFKSEIIDFLKRENLNYSLIVSSDVFIYVGELSKVFKLIKSRNKKKGKLAFSTEHSYSGNFQLQLSGRYYHSKEYIENLCNKYGYEIELFEIVNLRKENDSFIKGGLYILRY